MRVRFHPPAFILHMLVCLWSTGFIVGLSGQAMPVSSSVLCQESSCWIPQVSLGDSRVLLSAPLPQEENEIETEGSSRLKATLIGGGIGFFVGGVIVWDLLELDSDPDDPFSDTYYIVDGMTFWRAVGIGAVVGGIAGAIIGGTAFGPYRSGSGKVNKKAEVLPLLGPDRVGGVVRLTVR